MKVFIVVNTSTGLVVGVCNVDADQELVKCIQDNVKGGEYYSLNLWEVK